MLFEVMQPKPRYTVIVCMHIIDVFVIYLLYFKEKLKACKGRRAAKLARLGKEHGHTFHLHS